MIVVITNGAYGHNTGKSIKTINRGERIDLPEAEAKRLISLGVAAEVVETSAETAESHGEPPKDDPPASTPPQDENAAESHGENDSEMIVYSVDMTAAQLRSIMEHYGLKVKSGMTKREMVDALDAFFAENDEDDDPLPDLTPEAPVV